MELHLLNKDFENVHILDTFTSLLWVDKYWSSGILDVLREPDLQMISLLENAKYARLRGNNINKEVFEDGAERLMVIEDYNIKSDVDNGDQLIITGRSLESILDRRIVWYPTILTGNFQDSIELLLTENAIDASHSHRNIPGLEFVPSTDPVITDLEIDTQFRGESLYDVIESLCRSKKIGFHILFVYPNILRFQLYSGVDRSYEQDENPYVVFSPEFDNLISSDYLKSSKFEKTIVLVEGETGVGSESIITTATGPGGSKIGLERKEMFIKPSIQSNVGGVQLTEEEYLLQLQGKGKEAIAENSNIESFNGQVDTTLYSFGEFFFMGDILQVEDLYGHGAKYRVTEVVYSHDLQGERIFPTFSNVEDEEPEIE